MRLWLIAATCLSLNVALVAEDSDVSGRVTDAQGQPVANAMVIGNRHFAGDGYMPVRGATDAQGNYQLANVGAFLFFRKSELRPLAYRRAATESTVNVSLGAALSGGWKAPNCSREQLHERRYGDRLIFRVPHSAKLKKGPVDADNWRDFLTFPRDRNQQMIIWSGPLLGGGLGYTAPEEWYLEASSISENADPDTGIIDVRGTAPNGRHWRSVSWLTDIVSYHDVSDDGAKFFDAIIDTGCLSIP